MKFFKRLKMAVLCLLGVGMAACSGGKSADSPPSPTPGVEVFASGLITPDPTPTLIPATIIPNFGLAPDITNEVWLNTDTPLPLTSLRGKVVLVEFWTFG